MNKKLIYLFFGLLFMIGQFAFAQDVELDSIELVEPEEKLYEEDEYYEDYDDYYDSGVIFNEENNALWRTENDSLYNTKEISESTIDWYRKKSDFQYKEKGGVEKPNFNWLSQLFDNLENLFENLFGFDIPDSFFEVVRWLFILTVGGVVLYYLVQFLGVNVNWRRKKKQDGEVISFEELEENLEEVDFSTLIESAIKNKSYRVAVRLLFLKNLQSLSKRELIEWEIDKTNNDYKYELSATKLSSQFEEIVYLFEHIWYGNFELSEGEFQEAIQKFRTLDKRLGYAK